MTNRQEKLIENYIRLQVRKVISEKRMLREGSNDVYEFERWAKMRAKKANMDIDSYIASLLQDLSFSYDMPKN